MKQLLAILPLLMMSCQKNDAVTEIVVNDDSIIVSDGKPLEMDSSANGLVVLDQQKSKTVSKTFRVIAGDSIIKTISADMIPLTISDEFTTDQQTFVLKIKNFEGKNIVGKITPSNSNMNIRFNQIKLANGDFDGPFGLELSAVVSKPGEVWLIIGKSLMASGEAKGKFTVNVK